MRKPPLNTNMDMLFKEFVQAAANGKVVIFVDLDGTLVKSMHVNEVVRFNASVDDAATYSRLPAELQMKRWADLGGKVFDWYGEKYIAFARPNAKRFLLDCQSIAHTCIMTQGTQAYQTRVIETLGLPIKEIYGRENYGRAPKTPYGILVDDVPQIAFGKLHAIGIGADRFLHIRTWDDGDWKDNELMEFIPKIRKMVKETKHAIS